MPKKKAAEPQAAPAKKAPVKRASKKDEPKPEKASKKAVAKKSASVKSTKPEAKPTKSVPKRKNVKHPDVPNETVLSALASGKPFAKGELVAACGGDAIAVTKTIQRLRGLGKIVVSGNSARNTVYTKAG